MRNIDYHRPQRSKYGLVVLIGLLAGAILWAFIFSAPPKLPSSAEVAATSTSDPVLLAATIKSTAPPSHTIEPSLAPTSLPLVAAFDLPDLMNPGVTYQLSDFAGKPLIINLWASWCVPCLAEMPALEATYQEHFDEGLVILGVNQTSIDAIDAAREMIKTLMITFPNLRDDLGVTENIFQVRGLPTSLFITPDGEIAHQQIGQMSEAQIEEYTHRLLQGLPFGS